MYRFEELIDLIWLESLHMQAEHWFITEVLVWTTLAQLIAATIGTVIAYGIYRIVNRRVRRIPDLLQMTERNARVFQDLMLSLVFPVIALIVLLATRSITQGLGWPDIVLTTLINLLLVWIVIRLATRFIRNEFWSRVVALLAFAVATLDILELLQPTLLYLNEIGFRLGNNYLSVLEIMKGALQLAVLLWIAIIAARLLDQRVNRARSLTPSLRLLIGKLLKASFITAAVLIALSSIGIDLTAFAVFTGALGVGIGFGLQKPFSNLISGVILLLDRSIKPGDVIELGDPHGKTGQVFGWVTTLNARYASITTRDGTEWLIPNEDLITQRVINWSFKDNHLRLLTPIRVSYNSDIRKAMALATEAAKEHPRVLKDPAPVCRLMGFGESAVEMELRIWISDPVNGVINVRSEILLAMWDKFHANGIRIPLAQRDLHIRGDSELAVSLNRAN